MKELHVFEVEGVSFAAGLFWQPLSSSNSSSRKKEIQSLSKELSYNLVVTRESDMFTAGFSDTRHMKAGVFSAAAIISKGIEMEFGAKNFIFVAPIASGRWIYVVQRQSILPEGDLVFASEDAARAQFMEHMSVGDWEQVIVPNDWGVGQGIEKSFADFLPRTKKGKIKSFKWWRLMPVGAGISTQFSLHRGKILLGMAALSSLVVGDMYYKQWQEKKAAEEALQAALRDQSGSLIPLEHPWKKAPLASDFLEACSTALAQQNLFPGNWSISNINCVGGSLSISWVPNEGGWIKHLREIEPSAVIALDGSSASIQSSLPALDGGGDERVLSENERLVAMYSAAQAYGITFVAANVDIPPPMPGAQQPLPDWREISWQAHGVQFPDAVLAALDGPGFRMTSMVAKWSGGKFIWTMKGVQYVQP